MLDQIDELESEVEPSNIESEIKESLIKQETLGLTANPTDVDNDLGMIENSEPSENSET